FHSRGRLINRLGLKADNRDNTRGYDRDYGDEEFALLYRPPQLSRVELRAGFWIAVGIGIPITRGISRCSRIARAHQRCLVRRQWSVEVRHVLCHLKSPLKTIEERS